MNTTVQAPAANDFITRWSASEGAERANLHGFVYELCDLIGVARPDVATSNAGRNDYTFERAVEFKEADGSKSPGRIDLYKRGCFVMEAKQSREKGRPKELMLAGQPDLFIPDYNPRGKRSANRAWDQLMMSARHQVEGYARALPPEHGWPPFVLVCDIGHCIEVYADFTGQGKNYAQFPDWQGFRIYLEDLRTRPCASGWRASGRTRRASIPQANRPRSRARSQPGSPSSPRGWNGAAILPSRSHYSSCAACSPCWPRTNIRVTRGHLESKH